MKVALQVLARASRYRCWSLAKPYLERILLGELSLATKYQNVVRHLNGAVTRTYVSPPSIPSSKELPFRFVQSRAGQYFQGRGITTVIEKDHDLSRPVLEAVEESEPSVSSSAPAFEEDLSPRSEEEMVELTLRNMIRAGDGSFPEPSDRKTQRPVWSLEVVQHVLENVRARDVESLFVGDRCVWADWIIIATGRSSRHLRGMAEAVVFEFERIHGLQKSEGSAAVEGGDCTDWMVVDCGGIVVNFFSEDARGLYKLEELWKGPKPSDFDELPDSA